MRTRLVVAISLLAVACQDIAQPAAEHPTAEGSPQVRGLMVTSFYFDAEAAVRTLERTERLLADRAWIGRQAAIRGVTTDSIRGELTARVTYTEQYLERKGSAQGMTGPEHRRVVEGRMRSVQMVDGSKRLLPSLPYQAQADVKATVAGAPACQRRPRMESWSSDASVTVSGNNVTGTYSAIHTSDRPADQGLRMTWWHNQGGFPRGIATPSRRQLSICRDYATADHDVSWNRCAARSPAIANARSSHITSDVRYGGGTLITRGSQASDRVSFDRSGCSSGGDGNSLFEVDPLCASGYRAGTGECCDRMVYSRGTLWCVIVN